MRTCAGATIGVAAVCLLACAAGCTSGGARPLAPVVPPRPTESSHTASRIVLSPKTGQPVRHARTFATGLDHGRAWRVRRHSLRIFDVRDLTTSRMTLPGPVRGPRIDSVDVGPHSVVVATAGVRNIEIYSRSLSRHGRWHATGVRVHGRLQQRQTPHLYLSDRAGTVAALANYGLGMTVAQNFLFLSHDGGAKFHSATAPPGMLATNVSFLDGRTGFTVEGSIGVPGAMFRTDDGARSWHLVKLPGTRRRGERVEYGRPSPGRGGTIIVPVQRGNSRSRVTLYVSTDGGRTFRPTTRRFALSGPAHGGLPFDIGPAGPRRAVTSGGRGLVATVDGRTWHKLAWFHPTR